MTAQTHLFLCLQDNYGVLLHDPETGATASIDAPDAGAIEAALARTGWQLTDILVTHHHADHTQGVAELKAKYRCRVTAPAGEREPIADVDVSVRDGDVVKVGSLVGKVLETPGHTAGHIAYWFDKDNLAFVGDTLFSIGCGRLFEGTAETMWRSLLKLRGLPDDTLIFCGHEYTQSNIRFAQSVEPGNAALKRRAEEVDRLRAAGKPTVPSRLGVEKQANPFLRADDPEVAAAVGLAGKPAAQVFGELRERKNKA
ncbi:MAG: hydroxyacylglutathione hydrolase [Xanthobacteraceae bacterium]